jgi:outer membrane protein with beta-barrel domain
MRVFFVILSRKNVYMKFSLNCFLFLTALPIFSQELKEKLPYPMIEVDSLYREDQFYAAFSYNMLLNRPKGISQSKFSSGFTGGFLRDMPINKKRTIAIAAGLGVSYNKYFQNLVISKSGNSRYYNPASEGVDYSKNKFDQIFVDVPIEFRWRTSTPQSHKFWRVYSGIKLSYLVADKSRYIDPTYNIKVTQNHDFNEFQIGTYIVWGYNTWNFYGYYGLTPLFGPEAKLKGEAVGLNTLNFGLMFYIL